MVMIHDQLSKMAMRFTGLLWNVGRRLAWDGKGMPTEPYARKKAVSLTFADWDLA